MVVQDRERSRPFLVRAISDLDRLRDVPCRCRASYRTVRHRTARYLGGQPGEHQRRRGARVPATVQERVQVSTPAGRGDLDDDRQSEARVELLGRGDDPLQRPGPAAGFTGRRLVRR